jgi:hypothetical protein
MRLQHQQYNSNGRPTSHQENLCCSSMRAAAGQGPHQTTLVMENDQLLLVCCCWYAAAASTHTAGQSCIAVFDSRQKSPHMHLLHACTCSLSDESQQQPKLHATSSCSQSSDHVAVHIVSTLCPHCEPALIADGHSTTVVAVRHQWL